MDWKPTTLEMELAVANHFNIRKNLIVPNLYDSFFRHELDLFVLTPAGYGSEIEIKISRSDLKKDADKCHRHQDYRLKYLWFAIPRHLEKNIDLIPDRAGIIVVNQITYMTYYPEQEQTRTVCKRLRNPKQNGNYRFGEEDRIKLMRLASLRVWTLKKQLQREKEKWQTISRQTL